jgi:hypothetical protein
LQHGLVGRHAGKCSKAVAGRLLASPGMPQQCGCPFDCLLPAIGLPLPVCLPLRPRAQKLLLGRWVRAAQHPSPSSPGENGPSLPARADPSLLSRLPPAPDTLPRDIHPSSGVFRVWASCIWLQSRLTPGKSNRAPAGGGVPQRELLDPAAGATAVLLSRCQAERHTPGPAQGTRARLTRLLITRDGARKALRWSRAGETRDGTGSAS